MKKILLIIISIISLYSCNDIEPGKIDPKFKPYIQKFVDEAARRRIPINLAPMSMVHQSNIEGGRVAGITIHKDYRILIDTTSASWKYSPETLIFHELGHLILNRHHDNRTENGYPLSMMNATEYDVYSKYCDNNEIRDYYINELFYRNVPIPQWME